MKKIRRAIYPGTFDPITYGHLDILGRACAMFDEVILALSETSSKNTLFSLPERLEQLRKVVSARRFPCPVKITSFRGLLVNFAKKNGNATLVRGLRALSDFEYEFQMALMNRHQHPSAETVFLMPDEKYVYLSSSIIKEVARLGGDLNAFLPAEVRGALVRKLGTRQYR